MAKINIEVAYALLESQTLLSTEVEEGTTVEEAIELSGIQKSHPEIDLKVNKVGIFGKLTKLAQVLNEKDRIEIYRPLIADPKEVRRKRAAEGKKMTKGGGSADSQEDEKEA